jgi:antirestriction protein ArdC
MKNFTDKKDMYQIVTNRIIEQLEKGVMPWQKTWNGYGLAKNYVTGKAYKGINMLMMNFLTRHEKPYFLTFKQAQDLGGKVKKGAKAYEVIYFNVSFKDGENNTVTTETAFNLKQAEEKVKVLKFLKYYSVFNIDDVEGIDFQFNDIILNENEKLDVCEDILNNYPNAPEYVFENSNRAFYSPFQDIVNMPRIEFHTSAEFYYTTFFHELTHSTGHKKRLNREGVAEMDGFGSMRYAKEELIAELGAAFLCATAQIQKQEIIENNAAYLASWLKVLKEDKHFIFDVAAEAQKAVDYIYPNSEAENYALAA